MDKLQHFYFNIKIYENNFSEIQTIENISHLLLTVYICQLSLHFTTFNCINMISLVYARMYLTNPSLPSRG